MKSIFLDESGDMGFDNPKASKYFIVTLLIFDLKEEVEIKRIVKKIRQKILKKSLKQSPELKWNNSNHEIRQKILIKLSSIKSEIFTIIIDKSKIYDRLKEKKHKLYNYISNLIINECSIEGKFCLIVDRSKNKRSLRDDFDNYIRFRLKENSNIVISHEDSKSNGALQVLDFVSGAIFHKYEFENEDYYNLIRGKIVTEKPFP